MTTEIMTISDVIKVLEMIRSQYGDIPVMGYTAANQSIRENLSIKIDKVAKN
jgi:hypothetical protein